MIFPCIFAALACLLVDHALAVVELTDNTFYDYAKDKDVLLVDFYAPWCGDCKALEPDFESAASSLGARSLDLAKVDCFGAGKGLCETYGIKRWPTLKNFNRGSYTGDYNGGLSSSEISSYITTVENSVIPINNPYAMVVPQPIQQACFSRCRIAKVPNKGNCFTKCRNKSFSTHNGAKKLMSMKMVAPKPVINEKSCAKCRIPQPAGRRFCTKVLKACTAMLKGKLSGNKRIFWKHHHKAKKSTISTVTYTPNDMDPMRLRGGGFALQLPHSQSKVEASSGKINYHTLKLPGITGPNQIPAKKNDLQSILSGKSDGNLFLSTKDELNLIQIASSWKKALEQDNSSTTLDIVNYNNENKDDVAALSNSSLESNKSIILLEDMKLNNRHDPHYANSSRVISLPAIKPKDNASLSNFSGKIRLNNSKLISNEQYGNSTRFTPSNLNKKLIKLIPSTQSLFEHFSKSKNGILINNSSTLKNRDGSAFSLSNSSLPLHQEILKPSSGRYNLSISKSVFQGKIPSIELIGVNGTIKRAHQGPSVSSLSQSLGAVLLNLTYISPKLANLSSKLAGALFKLVNVSTEEEILAPRLANLLLRMTNISSILDQTSYNWPRNESSSYKRTSSEELIQKNTNGMKVVNLLIKAALSVFKSKKMTVSHEKVLRRFLKTS